MRKEFNVWFTEHNGSTNHKILEANNVLAVILYMTELGYGNNIIKIERRS